MVLFGMTLTKRGRSRPKSICSLSVFAPSLSSLRAGREKLSMTISLRSRQKLPGTAPASRGNFLRSSGIRSLIFVKKPFRFLRWTIMFIRAYFLRITRRIFAKRSKNGKISSLSGVREPAKPRSSMRFWIPSLRSRRIIASFRLKICRSFNVLPRIIPRCLPNRTRERMAFDTT